MQKAIQLRKGIYSQQLSPIENKLILERVGQKIGAQNLAYILVVFASISYPLGYLYCNENGFSVFQTSLMRGMVTVVLSFCISYYFEFDLQFKQLGNFRILMIRNFIMAVQGIIYTLVMFYLTQPVVQTIASTGPIFIFLLDYLINGVSITKKQFYGVILGISGVLLTINGDLIILMFDPTYETTSEFNYSTNDSFHKLLSGFGLVIIQFIWAYAQILTKKLQGINSVQISYHFGVQILLLTALVYPAQVAQSVPINKFLMSILVGGLPMFFGQIAFVGAITMSKNTGVISMLSLVSVIFGYFVSVIKYNQSINPFCTVGTLLIVFGLAKIVLKNKHNEEVKSHKVSISGNKDQEEEKR